MSVILLQKFERSSVSVTFLHTALQRRQPRGQRSFRRMAGDDGFADAYDAGAQVLGPDALQADPRAFQHQVELTGEQFRLREAGAAAKLREPLALRRLEGFDDAPRRVLFFGQLDRGIRVGAAAITAANHVLGHVLDPRMELGERIARVLGLETFPQGFGPLGLSSQIFGYEGVFRRKMPVKRHLVGAGRLRDGVYADRPNPMPIKQLVRRLEDAFARRHRRVSVSMGPPKFMFLPLDRLGCYR